MTTFEKIRHECLLTAAKIQDYEQAYDAKFFHTESQIDELRTQAAASIAGLAQMISEAAKVKITENN